MHKPPSRPRTASQPAAKLTRARTPQEKLIVTPGLARLVGQVQAMVEESGKPAGFDTAAWVASWLDRPLAALDGQRPAELMDTAEGQALVSQLVARMQSAAYS